jgi:pimeloyl-ACP methyl ester carboxylesterase
MPAMTDETLVMPEGRRIGWLARGPEEGTPVLYIHGWPGSRLEQGVVPDAVLERFGVRLISVDRPGWGNTDPLHGLRSERVKDVLNVCDALGIDRFPVMGVSCGGSYIFTLAAMAPDRVTRIVSVSGQMPYDDEAAIEGLAADQAEELPLMRAGRTKELEETCRTERELFLTGDPYADMSEGMSLPEKAWYAQPAVLDGVRAEMLEGFRQGAEGHIDDCLTSVQPFDVDVSTIRCPVRAVHGSIDDWEPLSNLTRFLDTIDDTQLIVLEGMGHFGPHLYPDLLIALATGAAG